MKLLARFIFIMLFCSSFAYSQVAINTDGSQPDNSELLNIKSIEKGVLILRMTFIQRNAIINPAEGLMVVCIDCSTSGSPINFIKIINKIFFYL